MNCSQAVFVSQVLAKIGKVKNKLPANLNALAFFVYQLQPCLMQYIQQEVHYIESLLFHLFLAYFYVEV